MSKEKKAGDSLAFNWVVKKTKRFIPYIILSAIISIVSSLILIALAYISKSIIDNGAKGLNEKFIISSISIFAVVVIKVLLDAFSSMFDIRLNGKYVNYMRSSIFSSLLKKKYSKIYGHHSGDVLNRFTSDIDVVTAGALGIIPSILSMVTKIIIGGWALITSNWQFGVAVVVVGFIFPLFGRMISKKYRWMHKEVQKTEGKSRAFIQESFANIVLIKTFESQKPIINKLNEYMDDNLRLRLKRNLYSVVVHTLLYSFFTFGYYFILVWGSSKLASGVLTFGTLNYYLQLVGILRTPLQNVSGILPKYYSMIASAERLMDLEEVDDEPEPIVDEKLEKLKSEFDSIEVKNLAFAYEDELILKNCNFSIKKNCITAITGESGSGKSTFFKVLLGLYDPTGGSVTLNGKTPVNSSTRGIFSYVPQGNLMLSGTIRDNITLCNPDITDEQIEKATKSAVIYDFVKSLPNGFDTVLTERGGGLSEGQLQRISIARALLFDAPVLLLDEATSALDEQTETELLSNIKNISGKTVVFITHRHTSLSVCDTIIHVENKQYSVIK